MKYLSKILVFILLISACSNESDEVIPKNDNDDVADKPINNEIYFPNSDCSDWEQLTPQSLNWNADAINNLLDYLETNNTRAFLILKDGKIVIEEYFGNTVSNTVPFTKDSQWYWASAGKTLTAALVGIAQEEGLLNIENKTSDYLGKGWTNMDIEKESLITIKNQLTMTTGLDYNVSNLNCTESSCLNYKKDAGTQWFYHNAPYTLLEKVVENASSMNYNTYTDKKIETPLGMNGRWMRLGSNNIYWSTARDMARFGLMIQNKGKWNGTRILKDEAYFNQMISTSQNLNPSYGYLWWLNGKTSTIFPSMATSFNIPLADQAPNDLIAGMGKNGQFVEVVPSKGLVVVRMGEAPDGTLVPIQFHNEMWGKINKIF